MKHRWIKVEQGPTGVTNRHGDSKDAGPYPFAPCAVPRLLAEYIGPDWDSRTGDPYSYPSVQFSRWLTGETWHGNRDAAVDYPASAIMVQNGIRRTLDGRWR